MGEVERFIEQKMKVPIYKETDVVVAGGGPAGLGAALAAARNGARTLLIERYGFLGGTATAGMVTTIHLPLSFAEQEQGIGSEVANPIVRGIPLELMNRMKEARGAEEFAAFRADGRLARSTIIDPEVFKYVVDRVVEEAGIELLLHTLVVDAIVEDDVMKGVIVENKSGRKAILANVVIDCTGDADVAARAGVPFEKGRKEDGLCQAMTLMFRMGGVDLERLGQYLLNHPEMSKIVSPEELKRGNLHLIHWIGYKKEAIERGELFQSFPHLEMEPMLRKGEVVANASRITGVDGTSDRDLTYAEIEGRKQVWKILNFAKKYVPGLEDAYLIAVAPQVGVRETRRIIGEHVLTVEEIWEGRKFDDVIAKSSLQIDIHQPDGDGWTYEILPPDKTYDIPYRCLIPKRINNLIVAGRCISGTHEAQGSYRASMGLCMAMGQAAGTAASLAIKNGISPRAIDIHKLQKTLLDQGVYLGKE